MRPENTTLRLADSVNVFDTGALAPGVTVTERGLPDPRVRCRHEVPGIFLQAEMYNRWLDRFRRTGRCRFRQIVDKGFFLQGAFYPVPKKLELYASTSQIFGDKDAGFDNSPEYLAGMNYYPVNSRNHRLNLQYIAWTSRPSAARSVTTPPASRAARSRRLFRSSSRAKGAQR